MHITPIGNETMYILDTASWRNFRPEIDREKCVNCGICFAYCPVNSVSESSGVYQISLIYCKGCGICARECPRKAITMVPEGGKEA